MQKFSQCLLISVFFNDGLDPMDRGAWWAAVYGVAQSRTRLKQLSSSSSSSELKWPDAKDNSDKCFWNLIKRPSNL